MIFRKAKLSHTSSDLDAHDRRRRGRRDAPEEPEQPVPSYDEETPPASGPRRAGQNGHGPYDISEVDPDDGRIDLGGLLVRATEGIELRLQVDEASESVVAALLVQDDSALELRAFAAPTTSTGLWDEIRREIVVETTKRGGVVTEATGPYGAEIKVVVPAQTPEGQQVTQASRIVGVDGPRWFLRGTLIGRAASEPTAAGPLLAAMSEVVVVRGKAPMAPRDMIPLKLPDSVRMTLAEPPR